MKWGPNGEDRIEVSIPTADLTDAITRAKEKHPGLEVTHVMANMRPPMGPGGTTVLGYVPKAKT